jgi:hypothetical protein
MMMQRILAGTDSATGKEDGHPLACISDFDADKPMMKRSTSTRNPAAATGQ